MFFLFLSKCIKKVKTHIGLTAFITALVVSTLQAVMQKPTPLELQQGIADKVLRFHVLANSDLPEDQQLKLNVRDEVLQYLNKSMPQQGDLDSTTAWIAAHTEDITDVACETLLQSGVEQSVRVGIEETYFPDRQYGKYYFPAGFYRALRVQLGKARGHNWWCVIYPEMCFTDVTCEEVETETDKIEPDAEHNAEKEKTTDRLHNILTEEEYDWVTQEEPLEIKFKFGN